MNLELEKDLYNIANEELIELSEQVNDVIDKLSKMVVEKKVDNNEKEL